jgi:uncharacterized protein (DUF2141 family)
LNARSVVALGLLLAVSGCSDDSGPVSGGDTDATAPAILSITPHDMFHVDVAFNEAVTKASVENPKNYTLVALSSPLTVGVPGDTMLVTPVLTPDGRTVSITAQPGMYKLMMSLTVYGVSDAHGNRITIPLHESFHSADVPDQTPPAIFERSPEPGSSNAAVGQPVVIQFSEPLYVPSLGSPPVNMSIEWNSESGPVDFRATTVGARHTLTPRSLLEYGEKQTITLTGIRDRSGNIMENTSWEFYTTQVVDHTPPAVVSISPSDGVVNVDPSSNISITFSERMDQFHFNVDVDPYPIGDMLWSADGKTLTYDPFELEPSQQYRITVYPGGVFDLSGNTVAGLTSAVFSTAGEFENGRLSGTVQGAAGTAAADPAGAIAVAAWYEPIAYAPVAGNRSYNLTRLADGPYAVLAFKDTNGDGDPYGEGDAIGAYGANPALGDFEFETVEITNGTHLDNLDFPLFDPSAVAGTVTWDGNYNNYFIFVGLFAKAGFDISTSQPVAITGVSARLAGKYSLNNIDSHFQDGDYYVAVFVDVNGNVIFDSDVDPAVMYGGFATPITLHLVKGSDALGIDLTISDPTVLSPPVSVTWPSPVKDGKFERLRRRLLAVGVATAASNPQPIDLRALRH